MSKIEMFSALKMFNKKKTEIELGLLIDSNELKNGLTAANVVTAFERAKEKFIKVRKKDKWIESVLDNFSFDDDKSGYGNKMETIGQVYRNAKLEERFSEKKMPTDDATAIQFVKDILEGNGKENIDSFKYAFSAELVKITMNQELKAKNDKQAKELCDLVYKITTKSPDLEKSSSSLLLRSF